MDDNENEIEKTEEEEPQDIKPDITKLLRVELIEKIEQNLEWDCEEAEQQPKRYNHNVEFSLFKNRV